MRSSVREFLASEAMAALGVPTTRALSLVATGDAVMRDMFYKYACSLFCCVRSCLELFITIFFHHLSINTFPTSSSSCVSDTTSHHTAAMPRTSQVLWCAV